MRTINVFKLSAAELYDLYGVELDDDGSVYDPVENKEFSSVATWKAYIDEQEGGGSHIEKFGGRYSYDDE